ncbi:hypothetical protein NP233_g11948 [Leucocoprinus birnbaumii]|uniref:Uncharacterized protein n=1 Tax=Leucocoprinus birnbaumii TaxID=56174 RepID=A0AAD5YQG6_9AGAR|nr:hypothetical protein NP233_g11948 [Leucocoprinus birnbaumii]
MSSLDEFREFNRQLDFLFEGIRSSLKDVQLLDNIYRACEDCKKSGHDLSLCPASPDALHGLIKGVIRLRRWLMKLPIVHNCMKSLNRALLDFQAFLEMTAAKSSDSRTLRDANDSKQQGTASSVSLNSNSRSPELDNELPMRLIALNASIKRVSSVGIPSIALLEENSIEMQLVVLTNTTIITSVAIGVLQVAYSQESRPQELSRGIAVIWVSLIQCLVGLLWVRSRVHHRRIAEATELEPQSGLHRLLLYGPNPDTMQPDSWNMAISFITLLVGSILVADAMQKVLGIINITPIYV